MGVATYIKNERGEIEEVTLQSGVKVKPVYGPEDLADLKYERDLGNPGEYPFTRGIHPGMYRTRPWTMRQYSGFGTPHETNKRFKLLIAHGQTGLNVAFDLPTQLGLDSDDPLAEGEVGRVGMAVDTLRDFEIAFADIPLDRIGSGLTINAVASVILAMYQATAEKYGFALDKISATPQNDILKEMVGRGNWIFPVEPSIRLIGDTMEYSAKVMPRTNPVSVCGYHMRESGCTPAQEIAYAFEIAMTYIDHVLQRGLDIDEFAPRISFNLDIFGNIFEQVAKFRAARRLWAQLLKERYKAKNPRSMWLRGLFGGGQTMALCSYDEAYTIPTPQAAIISLRTMQILLEEMGLRDTVDPLGGSYYIESLTNQIGKRITEEMKRVEEMGGMAHAVEMGYIQREVAKQAYLCEKAIQEGKVHKVGVNIYREEEAEEEVQLHEYNPATAEAQISSLDEVRRTRDQGKVARSLKDLEKAAKGRENVMPYLLESVKAYATLGEMTRIFKEVYGEFKEPSIF